MASGKKIGELLLASGTITGAQLEKALERQRLLGGSLGTNLLDCGCVTEDDLGKCLSLQFNVPYISLHDIEIPARVLEKMPVRTAEKNLLIPVSFDPTINSITVVMADPANLMALDEVKFASASTHVVVGIAPESSIKAAINIFYHGIKKAGEKSLDEIEVHFDPIPPPGDGTEEVDEGGIQKRTESGQAGKKAKKKILLVDQGPNRDLLDRYLREKGLNVTPVADPEQALVYAEESDYHLVILGDGAENYGEEIEHLIKTKKTDGIKTRIIHDLPAFILGESRKYAKLLNIYVETLDILLAILEMAAGHHKGLSHRVAVYSRLTALKLGFGQIEASEIMIASYLHDIYRMDLRRLLNQSVKSRNAQTPGSSWLTSRILEQIDLPEHTRDIILALHASMRESPSNHAQVMDIPLEARIIRTIHAFEDIRQRKQLEREDIDAAIEELRLNPGQLYDSRVVEHFFQVLQEEQFLNRASGHREEIAVIDDDPEISVLLELRLVNEGFKVRVFSDTNAAYEHMTGSPPDLVILEARSETIDGLKFIQQMKREASLTEIPVFFISSESDTSTIMQGLNLGAEDYFIKPFNLEIFYAKISKILKKSRQAETGAARMDGVSGSLKEMEFLDIVQILAAGMKTVMVLIEFGTRKGKIFLEKGKIVDARVDDLEGEEAFYDMVLWGEGTFSVHPDILSEKHTIAVSNDGLLLESCCRKDENSVIMHC